jgi:hypothetical protein
MKAFEKETQLACHLSHEETERNNIGKEGPRNCREKEAISMPSRWTVGPTTRHVSGSITQTPPLPPPQNPMRALPTSSRTRNPAALLPHLMGRLEAAKRTLLRSLLPCKFVHHGAATKRTSPQHIPLKSREERGETKMGVGASKTSTIVTTRILKRPPQTTLCPQSRSCLAELQATKAAPSQNPVLSLTRGTGSHASERGNGRAPPPHAAPPPTPNQIPRGYLEAY